MMFFLGQAAHRPFVRADLGPRPAPHNHRFRMPVMRFLQVGQHFGSKCRDRRTQGRFPPALAGLGGCSGFVLDRIAEAVNRKETGMRVIGIDPGLRRTGWGVVDVAGSRVRHVANGTCTSEGTDLALRLLSLYEQLVAVLDRHRPESAAVEKTFVNKDAAGTLKLGQARGIALLAPAQTGIAVAEYAPNEVKKVVVGVGHAAKEQVEHMVRLQLPGVELVGADASDALAIALCHAHHLQFAGRLASALDRAGQRA
jgi:crossover junction endodeoxyribonuclease RuvC